MVPCDANKVNVAVVESFSSFTENNEYHTTILLVWKVYSDNQILFAFLVLESPVGCSGATLCWLISRRMMWSFVIGLWLPRTAVLFCRQALLCLH